MVECEGHQMITDMQTHTEGTNIPAEMYHKYFSKQRIQVPYHGEAQVKFEEPDYQGDVQVVSRSQPSEGEVEVFQTNPHSTNRVEEGATKGAEHKNNWIHPPQPASNVTVTNISLMLVRSFSLLFSETR